MLGYAMEARALGRRTDITRFVVRNAPIKATCRSHRGLASDVRVLSHVLHRIRQSAPDTAAAQLDLPESALVSLSWAQPDGTTAVVR